MFVCACCSSEGESDKEREERLLLFVCFYIRTRASRLREEKRDEGCERDEGETRTRG